MSYYRSFRGSGFAPAPGAVGGRPVGFGEVPPPMPEEWGPVSESARVVEGGWSNLTKTGNWNVSDETALAMLDNPALAAKVRSSGGVINLEALSPGAAKYVQSRTGSGLAKIAVAVGVSAVLAMFLVPSRSRS